MYALYPRYADNEMLAFVHPYWRLLEKVDAERVRVFNLPSENLTAVRSSHPDFHSLVYRQQPDKYLLIAANLGSKPARAKLKLDKGVLEMSGEYEVYRIEAATGKTSRVGKSAGTVTTSELGQWDLEGFLFQK